MGPRFGPSQSVSPFDHPRGIVVKRERKDKRDVRAMNSKLPLYEDHLARSGQCTANGVDAMPYIR